MALIEHTLFGKQDKVARAIERIKLFDPSTSEHTQDLAPYYVAYSGGKDSDALRILFELSGVRYDLVHNHTTVDAPETVRYIRSIPGIQISFPTMTMWELIVRKRMPPTRIVRYCCEYLKERGGRNRVVATGIRWAESSKRKHRGSIEIGGRKSTLILNADNDESRDIFEMCQTQGKRIINPIIDWTDDEVWEFLHHYGCQSNPLYESGYKRVGCIGCPIAGGKMQIEEFKKYPKYKAAYLRAFEKMIISRYEANLPTEKWKTAEDVFHWWVTNPNADDTVDEDQLSFYD